MWLWVLEVTEHILSFPTDLLFGLFSSGGRSIIGPGAASPFGSSGGPSSQTVGSYTLAFAVVYLVAAQRLDRSDRRGIATAFTFAAVVNTVIGIALFADDLEQSGTGLAYLIVGIGFAYLGAVVVVAAHLIATMWNEPAETQPVLSRFYSGGSVQPSGPPPPPAGSVLG